MKLGLTIERDDAVIASLELGPGEYGIGRAADNAVVLPDRAISGHHALLRVGQDEAELLDQGSLNGIFVAGAKVGRIAFRRELTAEIGGYRLRAVVRRERVRRLPRLGAPDPRVGVLVATAVLTVATLLAALYPGTAALSELRQRETLRRGILLARSLAAINTLPLRARLLDQVRTTPIQAEDGVRLAQVADPYGKVLAPAKDLGDALESPEALRALKEPGPSVWTGPEGEIMAACPIRDGENLLGLALVTLDPARVVPALSTGRGLILAVLVAGALWVGAAWTIMRLTLRPVGVLAEDIGVALKSGAATLPAIPAGREFAELGRAVERLLILTPGASAPGVDRPPAMAAPDSETGQAPDQAAPPAPGASAEAWCRIDLAGYRLTDWSPAFTAHLAVPDQEPPVHLLTALADAALLAAVAAAVDDPSATSSQPVTDRPLLVVKEPDDAPGTVRVRVTEAA